MKYLIPVLKNPQWDQSYENVPSFMSIDSDKKTITHDRLLVRDLYIKTKLLNNKEINDWTKKASDPIEYINFETRKISINIADWKNIDERYTQDEYWNQVNYFIIYDTNNIEKPYEFFFVNSRIYATENNQWDYVIDLDHWTTYWPYTMLNGDKVPITRLHVDRFNFNTKNWTMLENQNEFWNKENVDNVNSTYVIYSGTSIPNWYRYEYKLKDANTNSMYNLFSSFVTNSRLTDRDYTIYDKTTNPNGFLYALLQNDDKIIEDDEYKNGSASDEETLIFNENNYFPPNIFNGDSQIYHILPMFNTNYTGWNKLGFQWQISYTDVEFDVTATSIFSQIKTVDDTWYIKAHRWINNPILYAMMLTPFPLLPIMNFDDLTKWMFLSGNVPENKKYLKYFVYPSNLELKQLTDKSTININLAPSSDHVWNVGRSMIYKEATNDNINNDVKFISLKGYNQSFYEVTNEKAEVINFSTEWMLDRYADQEINIDSPGLDNCNFFTPLYNFELIKYVDILNEPKLYNDNIFNCEISFLNGNSIKISLLYHFFNSNINNETSIYLYANQLVKFGSYTYSIGSKLGLYDDINQDNSKNLSITTSNLVASETDPYKQFMLNQGNQFDTGLNNQYRYNQNTFTGMFRGDNGNKSYLGGNNPWGDNGLGFGGSIINGIKNLFNDNSQVAEAQSMYDAKIADLHNQPNNANNQNNTSLFKLLTMWRLQFKFNWITDNEKIKLAKYYNMNGYYSDKTYDITDPSFFISRIYHNFFEIPSFRYLINNTNLPIETMAFMEKLFKKGVRLWHWNKFNDLTIGNYSCENWELNALNYNPNGDTND